MGISMYAAYGIATLLLMIIAYIFGHSKGYRKGIESYSHGDYK